MQQHSDTMTTGLEDINLEFIRKLKIKHNDWLQPTIVLYFKFETVLKFYNLEAWFQFHI